MPKLIDAEAAKAAVEDIHDRLCGPSAWAAKVAIHEILAALDALPAADAGEEVREEVDALLAAGVSEDAVLAMEGLFAFSDAMWRGKLSILDLEAVIKMAVDSGHDVLVLQLEMAQIALNRFDALPDASEGSNTLAAQPQEGE